MNFYEILNLKTNATLQEIKSQYRKLCLQFHPDKNNSPEATEKFKMINRAYETLSNGN
jgi:curved DNA-binding protein CbpA